MNKIQRFSFFLRVFFQIAFILWPIMVICYWAFSQYLIPNFTHLISLIPANLEILHPITATDVFWGIVISILPSIIIMTILYFLINLFKLYEQGKIFTLQNVKYLKHIGITMLIGQVVNFVYEGLISFALTFHNPHGHQVSSFYFGTDDIYNIVIAIMIIVISWIMAEGCKLQDENQYTV